MTSICSKSHNDFLWASITQFLSTIQYDNDGDATDEVVFRIRFVFSWSICASAIRSAVICDGRLTLPTYGLPTYPSLAGHAEMKQGWTGSRSSEQSTTI